MEEKSKKRKQKIEKQVIGRRDKISLPDFDLKNLDAKIDTGAYSSSLHCRILGESKINDTDHVCFIPLGKKYKARNAQQMLIPVYKRKTVKSSSGHTEERYFVVLKVKIGDHVFETEFSLTDRSSMKCTILLGRKFLKGRYMVDVSRTYIFHKKELRALKKTTLK